MFDSTITSLLTHYKHNPYVCIGKDFSVFEKALECLNANRRITKCIGIFSQKEIVEFIESSNNKATILTTLTHLNAKQVTLEFFLRDCDCFLPPALLPLQAYCQFFCFKPTKN